MSAKNISYKLKQGIFIRRVRKDFLWSFILSSVSMFTSAWTDIVVAEFED